jgi:hypothetical protein
MIWQFRDADPEFGFLQSKELEEHLKEVLAVHKEVEVIRGGGVSDGYIEVRPAGVSKGLFLEYAIKALEELGKPANFIMAIGDDSSDEPMFDVLSRISDDDTNCDAYGVTVGKKPSTATSYVDDPRAVMDLLSTLTRSTQRDNRYFSAVDLPSKDGTTSSLMDNTFAFPITRKRPSGGSGIKAENRAMSVDNLALSGQLASPPRGFSRVTSSSHLTINSYLESINDGEEEDDAGIFF